jgi:hypothetical protein
VISGIGDRGPNPRAHSLIFFRVKYKLLYEKEDLIMYTIFGVLLIVMGFMLICGEHKGNKD